MLPARRITLRKEVISLFNRDSSADSIVNHVINNFTNVSIPTAVSHEQGLAIVSCFAVWYARTDVAEAIIGDEHDLHPFSPLITAVGIENCVSVRRLSSLGLATQCGQAHISIVAYCHRRKKATLFGQRTYSPPELALHHYPRQQWPYDGARQYFLDILEQSILDIIGQVWIEPAILAPPVMKVLLSSGYMSRHQQLDNNLPTLQNPDHKEWLTEVNINMHKWFHRAFSLIGRDV